MKKTIYIIILILLIPSIVYATEAQRIQITDTGGFYSGTEVEAALQEIGTGTTLNSTYLRLDATNDPITEDLKINGSIDVDGFTGTADRDSGYNFGAFTNTYTWSGGTNAWTFSSGGSDVFTVDVNNDGTPEFIIKGDGNVGIGSTSIFEALRVGGDMTIGVGTDPTRIVFDGEFDDRKIEYNSSTQRMIINESIQLEFGEVIFNTIDDFIQFSGGSGSDNTDVRFDLDGTEPNIDSATDTTLRFGEANIILGDNSSGDITLNFDGDTGLDGSIAWDVSHDEFDVNNDLIVTGFVSAEGWSGVADGHSGYDFGTFTYTWTSAIGDAEFFNIDNSFVVQGDGNVGIGMTDPTVLLDVNGDFTLSGGSDYLFTKRTSSLVIQAKTAAAIHQLELYTNDGDGTDDILLNIYAVGTPSSITNRERLQLGYESSIPEFRVFSEANGTGTLRDLNIYTEGNEGQLFLDTGGNVGIGISTPSAKVQVLGSGDLLTLEQSSGDDVTTIDNNGLMILGECPASNDSVIGFYANTGSCNLEWTSGIDFGQGTDYIIAKGTLDGTNDVIRLTDEGDADFNFTNSWTSTFTNIWTAAGDTFDFRPTIEFKVTNTWTNADGLAFFSGYFNDDHCKITNVGGHFWNRLDTRPCYCSGLATALQYDNTTSCY